MPEKLAFLQPDPLLALKIQVFLEVSDSCMQMNYYQIWTEDDKTRNFIEKMENPQTWAEMLRLMTKKIPRFVNVSESIQTP